uniref:Chitinase n=1 Tax=Biomphalaria glabrata TaxID=6526 RepID=A0A2C9KYT4_BIOGL
MFSVGFSLFLTVILAQSMLAVCGQEICRQNNWAVGTHPHPTDCRQFVECNGFLTTIYMCPVGETFDPIRNKCWNASTAAPCNDHGSTVAPVTPGTSQCTTKAKGDVLFILDSSSSIGYGNYTYLLQFVASLASSFSLGPDLVQFSVVVFASFAESAFPFNRYYNKTALQQAILNIPYVAAGTNTYDALQFARTIAFSASHGSRADVAHVAIVVTDGLSSDTNRTKHEAELLKGTGVHVLSVGVGDFNSVELEGMASSLNNVFRVGSYEVLNTIEQDITVKTCNEAVVQAGHIKDRGYHMISIGVGANVDQQELVILASNQANIFLATSYDVLHRIQEEVANRTCEIPSEVTHGDLWNVCAEQNWVNGIHAHPFDCTKFIECTFLHTAIMTCPPPLVYDPLKQTCLHKEDAIPCEDYSDYNPFPTLTTQVPQKPPTVDVSSVCRNNNWLNGTHPHPSDCSYYLVCINYVTHPNKCPDHTVFDPITRSCMSPALAAPCNDHVTSASVTSPVNVATTTSPHYNLQMVCLQFNLQDGIYPDPGSCYHFVECVAGITYHLICPEGLQFNAKKLVCDDVHLINCNDNYNFAFEHVSSG